MEFEEKNLDLVASMSELNIGDPVVFYPKYLHKQQIKNNQLGIVSSMNDKYVFVKYDGSETAQATNPKDLYLLYNRPDLMAKIPGFVVEPFNRICELWLEQIENENDEKKPL